MALPPSDDYSMGSLLNPGETTFTNLDEASLAERQIFFERAA